MRGEAKLGAAGTRALMNARMDERIEHEQIAPLWQRRQDREVGNVAAGEKDRGFRAEKSRGLGLKAFVLGAIAAQQARTAGADRSSGFHRGRYHRLRAGDYRIMYVVDEAVITIERVDRLMASASPHG